MAPPAGGGAATGTSPVPFSSTAPSPAPKAGSGAGGAVVGGCSRKEGTGHEVEGRGMREESVTLGILPGRSRCWDTQVELRAAHSTAQLLLITGQGSSGSGSRMPSQAPGTAGLQGPAPGSQAGQSSPGAPPSNRLRRKPQFTRENKKQRSWREERPSERLLAPCQEQASADPSKCRCGQLD
jgi:hypothetical protein